MARTMIDLDDEMVAQAKEIYGTKTKAAAVRSRWRTPSSVAFGSSSSTLSNQASSTSVRSSRRRRCPTSPRTRRLPE